MGAPCGYPLVLVVPVFLAVSLYLLPVWVALFRWHRRRWLVAALNVLAGWTVIGWVAALVWASAAGQREEPASPAARRLALLALTLAAAVVAVQQASLARPVDLPCGAQALLLTGFAALLSAYLLPTWLAIARRHPAWLGLAAYNLALGWTGIGWLFALIRALDSRP